MELALRDDAVPAKGEKLSFTQYLKRQLKDIEPKTKKTYAELVIATAVRKAALGDYRFAAMIWDRIDGKVPDRIAGADGGAVQVDVMLAAIRDTYGKDDPHVIEAEARILEDE